MSETITPKVGVGTFIVRQYKGKLQILLGKRIGEHGGGEWSLPGGHVELFEHPRDTSIRETLEETGLEINCVQVFHEFPYANRIWPETGKHYITLFFVAKICGGELENKESHKCEGWEWFAADNLPENMFGSLKEIFSSPDIFMGLKIQQEALSK